MSKEIDNATLTVKNDSEINTVSLYKKNNHHSYYTTHNKTIINHTQQQILHDSVLFINENFKGENICGNQLRNLNFKKLYAPFGLNLNISEEEFKTMSYGETKLITLLFHISKYKPKIIILDNPEIGLSTKWQKLLIPVIMRIIHTRQIIITTHSTIMDPSEKNNNTIDLLKYYIT